MKFTIGVILGVILGAAILIGILVFIFFSNFSAFNLGIPNATNPVKSINPTISSTAHSSIPNSHDQPGASVMASIPTASSVIPQDVNFTINISDFSISGMKSATINAQITNTGTVDAHNVRIKMEINSKGSTIYIDDQPFYEMELGTIKSGITITAQVYINVKAADGLKVLASGATIKLTIYSDEKIQDITYNLPPQI